MATYTVEFRRNGQPVEGAEVIAVGERFYSASTPANGQISATIGYSNPLAVHFLISKPGSFQQGSGPHRLIPDATTVINL